MFYTPQEYYKLSSKQRHKLKFLHEQRETDYNKIGNGKWKYYNLHNKLKFKKLRTENNSLKQRISTL